MSKPIRKIETPDRQTAVFTLPDGAVTVTADYANRRLLIEGKGGLMVAPLSDRQIAVLATSTRKPPVRQTGQSGGLFQILLVLGAAIFLVWILFFR